jgi:hypothetical protein
MQQVEQQTLVVEVAVVVPMVVLVFVLFAMRALNEVLVELLLHLVAIPITPSQPVAHSLLKRKRT